MATEIGQSTPPVKELVLADPYGFDFFQAVRLLKIVWKETIVEKKDNRGAIHFKSHLSLSFPSNTIASIEEVDDKDEYWYSEMVITFMGMVGPQGVLPRHYTETLLSRKKKFDDTTAIEFFDIFTHHVVSLFYDAWEKYNFWVGYESNNQEPLSRYLLDMAGIGTYNLQNQLEVTPYGIKDETLAYYAGLISHYPHSVTSLEAILSDFFQCNIEITQLEGEWLNLDPSFQTSMGRNGQNCILGENIVIGQKVWNVQSQLKVNIGPIEKEKFDHFLPEQPLYEMLVAFIKFYLGNAINLKIQLKLSKDEVPDFILSPNADKGVQLGWTSWIGKEKLTEILDNTVFSIKGT